MQCVLNAIFSSHANVKLAFQRRLAALKNNLTMSPADLCNPSFALAHHHNRTTKIIATSYKHNEECVLLLKRPNPLTCKPGLDAQATCLPPLRRAYPLYGIFMVDAWNHQKHSALLTIVNQTERKCTR